MNDLTFLSKKDNKKIKNKELTKPNFWTEEEDKILKQKAEEFKYKNWNSIATFIPGRTSIQCSARYRRIRPGLVKGAWDKEEDNKLLSLYEKYGKNWAAISKEMPHRTGKQIRDRFLNSLDSKFERGKFTEEEDQAIIKYFKIYGNSWAKIAKKLKTRTGDMVKNRFYSSLKKNIFKNKNLLKIKRERSKNKNKHKSEETNLNSAMNQNTNIFGENKIITASTQESNDKMDKNEKIEKNEDSNYIEYIKDLVPENDEICNQKNKTNNNTSTNVVSYDSNNSSDNVENKTYHNFGNNKAITLFNNNENDNNNHLELKLKEKPKKKGNINNHSLNENNGINSYLLMKLNDNKNYNQKDEVDEKLEKLKSYKQNLKEQLNIILDLENIINRKLTSVQKDLEKN